MIRAKKGLTALASGVALGLSFPVFDLWPLAWVSFVPLLFLVRSEQSSRAFLLGWMSGLAFYLLTLYWIAPTIASYSNVPFSVSVILWFVLASVLACYSGCFLLAVSFLHRRGIPAWLSAAPVWAVLEWLRSFFLVGFPWAALGYSQYSNRSLIQLAEVTGVYGVSALIVLANAVIEGSWQARKEKAGAPYKFLALLVLVLFLLTQWGSWRAGQILSRKDRHGLRVGFVQGNIAQEDKWEQALQDETLQRYLDLTNAAVEKGARLVVWPETAVPFFFQSDPRSQELMRRVRDYGVHLLFGSPAFEARPEVTRLLNRAYLISPKGLVAGFYDKLILVPFGEYVPLHTFIPFVRKLVVGIGDFAAGKNATVLSISPRARLGVLICYEGIFPALSRQFVSQGANFLVNITNDAWFGKTSAPYQHLSMLIFRAIENRVPVVRAANTGFSAFIAEDGTVREKTKLFTPDVRSSFISWDGRKTFYTRWGDLFVWLCLVFVAGLLGRASGLFGKFRRKA